MVTWCTSEVPTVTCIRQQNGHSLRCLISTPYWLPYVVFTLILVALNWYADFLLQMVMCIRMCDGGWFVIRHNWILSIARGLFDGPMTFQELVIFLSSGMWRRFGETCLLKCHNFVRLEPLSRPILSLYPYRVFPRSDSTLKMEEARYPESSVIFYLTSRCHIQETIFIGAAARTSNNIFWFSVSCTSFVAQSA
jgi:hypothetical protein